MIRKGSPSYGKGRFHHLLMGMQVEGTQETLEDWNVKIYWCRKEDPVGARPRHPPVVMAPPSITNRPSLDRNVPTVRCVYYVRRVSTFDGNEK